jgi:hypothetical protein
MRMVPPDEENQPAAAGLDVGDGSARLDAMRTARI